MLELLIKEIRYRLWVKFISEPKSYFRKLKTRLCISWHDKEPCKPMNMYWYSEDMATPHKCSKCGATKYKLPNGEWRKV
jgi:hypothetical protein